MKKLVAAILALCMCGLYAPSVFGAGLNRSIFSDEMKTITSDNTARPFQGHSFWEEMKTITPIQIQSNRTVTVEAEHYASLTVGKIMDEAKASGGKYVGDFIKGSRASYRIQVQKAGTYEIVVMAASPKGGSMTLQVEDGEKCVRQFAATGDWQNYARLSMRIWLDAGEQTVSITNNGDAWNFDCMMLTFLSEKQQDTNVAKGTYMCVSSGNAAALHDENPSQACFFEEKEGAYVVMRTDRVLTLHRVVILEGPNCHVLSGTLEFSDGTKQKVGELSAEGTEISVGEKKITWVKFIIDQVNGNTKAASLAEIQLWGTYDLRKDGLLDLAPQGYYRTGTKWLRTANRLYGFPIEKGIFDLAFCSPHKVEKVILTGLPDSIEGTLKAEMIADGKEPQQVTFRVNDKGEGVLEQTDLTARDLTFRFDSLKKQKIEISTVLVMGKAMKKETEALFDQVNIVNRWQGQALMEQNGKLTYGSITEYDSAAVWSAFLQKDGSYVIRNAKTGHDLVLSDEKDQVLCIADGGETAAGRWKILKNDGYYSMENCKKPGRLINLEHIEENPGMVTASADSSAEWYSAMWSMKQAEDPKAHHYEITANRVDSTAGDACAFTPDAILSTIDGVTEKWELSEDISGLPVFRAPNSVMTEAVYNLSMEEAVLNIHPGKYGNVFWTGVNWGGVWTRDVSMSIQYALGRVFPKVSRDSIAEKIVPAQTNSKDIWMQDTGTGGSYPNSVDRVILMIAAWENYLNDGNKKLLEKHYQIAVNTLEQDYHVCYDPRMGLFNGETGGLDHRSKTYPDWMDETFPDSIINITQSKSSIVNIVYAEVMELLSKAAGELGKGEDVSAMWALRSDRLKKQINRYFWNEERGMYASFIYPDYMGSPVADKYDVISNGYALMFDVADEKQKNRIMEEFPLVVYGAPTVWPQKNGRQGGTIYHNRGVWPGWEATLMLGAKQNGNLQVADELWRSCIRGAAVNRTNKEVIDFTTGEGLYSDRQLWSVAATLAGYYRVLFGMEIDEKGMTFAPFVPGWMDGPFTLEQYVYHQATLNLRLEGRGDTLVSMTVNGKEVGEDYVLPADAKGEFNIVMKVKDSGRRSQINLGENGWAVCPDMPVLTAEKDGTLSWKTDDAYTYKLWNGREYLDVTGKNSYRPGAGYGVYSLVAVDKNGIYSELSKPVIVNDKDRVILLEAEEQSYVPSCFDSKVPGFTGRGYVNDFFGSSAKMELTVKVDRAGEYLFSARYSNPGDATGYNYCGIRSVYVDNMDAGTLVLPLTNHAYDRSSRLSLYLTEGEHIIRVFYDTRNWYDQNISIDQNSVSYDSFRLDYVGEHRAADTDGLKMALDLAEYFRQEDALNRLTPEEKAALEEMEKQAEAVLKANPIRVSQRIADEGMQRLLAALEKAVPKQEDDRLKALIKWVLANGDSCEEESLKALKAAEGGTKEERREALFGLKLTPDTAYLSALCDTAARLDDADCSKASKKALAEALTAACRMVIAGEQSPARIHAAEQNLMEAMKAVRENKGDSDALMYALLGGGALLVAGAAAAVPLLLNKRKKN